MSVPPTPAERLRLEVVLFSGGRGSGALTALLVTNPRVALTVAVNGYDDGASTGEVRRFLGDSLGPSDFRKNASRLARLSAPVRRRLSTCWIASRSGPARPPTAERAAARRAEPRGRPVPPGPAAGAGRPCRMACAGRSLSRSSDLPRRSRRRRRDSVSRTAASATWCSPAAFLLAGRDFNAAVDDYCALAGPAAGRHRERDRRHRRLPGGASTRTDGCSAARKRSSTRSGATGSTTSSCSRAAPERGRPRRAGAPHAARARGVADRARRAFGINPRLARRRSLDADLIIYAPGTQHSSLFPSYLTPGLSDAIAANLTRSSCSSPTSRPTPKSPAAAPSTSSSARCSI